MSYKVYNEKRKEQSKGNEGLANGQRTLAQMSKREQDDADLEDVGDVQANDETAPNGHAFGREFKTGVVSPEPNVGSPGSSRTGAQARHNFDAVRNGFDMRPGPMEE